MMTDGELSDFVVLVHLLDIVILSYCVISLLISFNTFISINHTPEITSLTVTHFIVLMYTFYTQVQEK